MALAQHITFLKNPMHYACNKIKQGLYKKQGWEDPSKSMALYAARYILPKTVTIQIKTVSPLPFIASIKVSTLPAALNTWAHASLLDM